VTLIADGTAPGAYVGGVRRRLLIVHHTPSPPLHSLLHAVVDGARDPAIEGVDVVLRPALTAGAVDVLEADGIVLGSPVNLGYLSGALKHFFDTIYYPTLDAGVGRPYAAYLHGNDDTAGAERALTTIVTGLGWKAVAPLLRSFGTPTGADLEAAREVGAVVAASLMTS
jgi:NAD(P)H-dependent FMN reductase